MQTLLMAIQAVALSSHEYGLMRIMLPVGYQRFDPPADNVATRLLKNGPQPRPIQTRPRQTCSVLQILGTLRLSRLP